MPQSFFGMEQEDQAIFLNGLALLCLVFWGPGRELCQELVQPEFSGELSEFASLMDDEAREAAEEMTSFLAEFGDAESLFAALEENYARLFLESRGEGAASLYHSYYEARTGPSRRRPPDMMALRLEAAGLDFKEKSSGPPDHLAIELEYLFILFEEALAAPNRVLRAEARAFADKEMLPWLEKFEARLSEEDDAPFFPAAARLLISALTTAAL
ncbi:MAG: molecular chaperone TorD family protein [Pseudomonadota bacterium]